MVCDGMRCFWRLKIAGKRPISSQRVAGPYDRLFLSYHDDILYGLSVKCISDQLGLQNCKSLSLPYLSKYFTQLFF